MIANLRRSGRQNRKARILAIESPDAAIIQITDGNKVDSYRVWAMGCPFAGSSMSTFRIWKLNEQGDVLDETGYDVSHGSNLFDLACECPGWKARGHTTACRHISLIDALYDRGILADGFFVCK